MLLVDDVRCDVWCCCLMLSFLFEGWCCLCVLSWLCIDVVGGGVVLLRAGVVEAVCVLSCVL